MNIIIIYVFFLSVRIVTPDNRKCPVREFDINGHCEECPVNCVFCISKTECSFCEKGFKGQLCNETCSSCRPQTACEQKSGYCADSCQDGLSGELCDRPCKQNCINCSRSNISDCHACLEGHWGSYCEHICPDHCKEKSCNNGDGSCTKECNKGYWGSHCKHRCPTHCLVGDCSKDDGSCSKGCENNYTGRTCMCPANCICGGNGQCLECEYTTGIICDDRCSDGCIGKFCELEGRRCREGCLQGFVGVLCEKADVDAESFGLLWMVGFVVIPVLLGFSVLCKYFINKRKLRSSTAKDNGAVSKDMIKLCEQHYKEEKIKPSGESRLYPKSSKRKPKNQFMETEETTPCFKEGIDETGAYEEIGENCTRDRSTKKGNVAESASSQPAEHDEQLEELTEQSLEEELKAMQKVNRPNNPVADDFKSELLSLKDLKQLIKSKPYKEYAEEFQRLPIGPTKPYKEATKRNNLLKNRFRGIYPYDSNRVILKDKTFGYTNASYINGYQQMKEYIACIGPTKKNVSSFWELVWQEKCSTIVMLANLQEKEIKACDQYWPDQESGLVKGNRDQKMYGRVAVNCASENSCNSYVVRSLEIKKGDEPRCIKHVQYKAWQNTSIPNDVKSFIEFWKKVNELRRDNGPLLVHCSAGIGRTGIFIALDILAKQGETEGQVDVFGCVKKLRNQRVNMIPSPDQYTFLHRAVLNSLVDESQKKSLFGFPKFL